MAYGYYQSMQELIKAANKALSRNVSDNIKLTYNAFTGKVTVQIKNGFQFAVMKPLSIILGFGGKDVILKKTTESPYVADLTTVSTIYVYCDIVEPQIVGDTSAQLLKSIPAEGKFGDIIAQQGHDMTVFRGSPWQPILHSFTIFKLFTLFLFFLDFLTFLAGPLTYLHITSFNESKFKTKLFV